MIQLEKYYLTNNKVEKSQFIAQIIALLYLATGIAALRGVLDFKKVVDDFEKSPALTFIVGLIALILGMLLVRWHNIWIKDWSVLITLFGWISVLKGFMFLAFPENLGKFKGWFKNTKQWGYMLVAISMLFAYFGFVL